MKFECDIDLTVRPKMGPKMRWSTPMKTTYSVVIHFMIVQPAGEERGCNDVFGVTKIMGGGIIEDSKDQFPRVVRLSIFNPIGIKTYRILLLSPARYRGEEKQERKPAECAVIVGPI